MGTPKTEHDNEAMRKKQRDVIRGMQYSLLRYLRLIDGREVVALKHTDPKTQMTGYIQPLVVVSRPKYEDTVLENGQMDRVIIGTILGLADSFVNRALVAEMPDIPIWDAHVMLECMPSKLCSDMYFRTVDDLIAALEKMKNEQTDDSGGVPQ